MVWRDTPALRGGGFEFSLDYNWIKKGVGVAGLWPLGCWSVVNLLQFVLMLSSACGCREWLVLFLASSNFQSWGQAQKSKMSVMSNRVIGLLGKWCRDS